MSVENGDPDRRSAPVPAWEQRGPAGAPPPGYRQPPRYGPGPAPQGVRQGPPPVNQGPPTVNAPPTNRVAPPVPGSGPPPGAPYRQPPGRPGPGQPGPQQQAPPRRPQPGSPTPVSGPAPLSGPASGIGGLSTGAGNAYSQTPDPADRRNDYSADYSADYLADPIEGHETGAQMTPAPTSRANRTNRTSIAALALSVLGVTFIFGIIGGHVARSQIRHSGEQGSSFAIAALWVGYLYLAATLLVLSGYLYIVGSGS